MFTHVFLLLIDSDMWCVLMMFKSCAQKQESEGKASKVSTHSALDGIVGVLADAAKLSATQPIAVSAALEAAVSIWQV